MRFPTRSQGTTFCFRSSVLMPSESICIFLLEGRRRSVVQARIANGEDSTHVNAIKERKKSVPDRPNLHAGIPIISTEQTTLNTKNGTKMRLLAQSIRHADGVRISVNFTISSVSWMIIVVSNAMAEQDEV